MNVDNGPPAKRPCLQATLFGKLVPVVDPIYPRPASDYERFVNAFVERRADGDMSKNRASLKCEADDAWRSADNSAKRAILEAKYFLRQHKESTGHKLQYSKGP